MKGINDAQQFIITFTMKMQQILREQNYHLKNEISDLKNAFDLNRDILKILSNYNKRTDPQLNLLMQIISRLTTVNNQSMINSMDLIQQKHVLKQQNMRLNFRINALETQLEQQLQINRLTNQPNQAKFLMQEQFQTLNKELMAANEERIVKEQEIEHWKHKYTELVQEKNGEVHTNGVMKEEGQHRKIRRRYNSSSSFRFETQKAELEKQNGKLKKYIEELQNRLIIFIKAYNLEEEVMPRQRIIQPEPQFPFYQAERQQIRLLKYALNDIHIERRQQQYILTITQRFRERDTMNNEYVRVNRSSSWPKNKPPTDPSLETEKDEHFRTRENQL